AGIILSGGRSKRFQRLKHKPQDKALVKLLGKPLLIHSIENVREVVDDVVICVNSEKRKSQYSRVLEKYNIKDVRLLTDERCNELGGPILGILTGLSAVNADYCFILPSDMPLLKPKVIDYMFNSINDALLAVPMWPDGRLETLTMAIKKSGVQEIVKTLCQLKRPRSDDIIRGALNVMLISIFSDIKAFDHKLKSFININSQSDLAQLQPRQSVGPITENLRFNLGELPISELLNLQTASVKFNQDKIFEASETFSSSAVQLEKKDSFFWAALSRENEGKSLLSLSQQQTTQELFKEFSLKGKKALFKAANLYESEAKIYEKLHENFLAERARANKEWCELWAQDISYKKGNCT
ncbi:molybdenum cofactor guanylyltransferase, partial [Candidatus Bathyarchaeota archaeon]